MEPCYANSKIKKKALKQVVKENVKKSKGFVKFCYVLTFLMQIAAVILGILNIIYVIEHKNPLALIFLILTFLFPFLFSALPATVYIVSCGGEYRFRKKEAVSLSNDEILYGYHDCRVGFENSTFVFHIRYDQITRYEYDEPTRCLTVYGKIPLDVYKDGAFDTTEEYEGLDLLNVYNVDIKALVDRNCPGRQVSPASK